MHDAADTKSGALSFQTYRKRHGPLPNLGYHSQAHLAAIIDQQDFMQKMDASQLAEMATMQVPGR